MERLTAYTLTGRYIRRPTCPRLPTSRQLPPRKREVRSVESLAESEALVPNYAIVEGNTDASWDGSPSVLTVEVTVFARATHTGLEPENDVHAILAMDSVPTEIERFGEQLTKTESDVAGIEEPSCVPSLGEGGEVDVIPPSCTLIVDIRIPPDDDTVEIEAESYEPLERADSVPVTHVKDETTLTIEPYLADPDTCHVRALQANAAAFLDVGVPVGAGPGPTDSRLFVAQGTQCVNFGFGDDQSNFHGTDENIVMDEETQGGPDANDYRPRREQSGVGRVTNRRTGVNPERRDPAVCSEGPAPG